jgi:hypothetical protein
MSKQMPWLQLAFFTITVELLALYGLAFSGHFPAEFRNPELRGGAGAMLFWATLVVAVLAAIVAGCITLRVLSWPSIVIGGGAMLLAAPLLLRPFPDRFVNGLAGLATFAMSALGTAVLLWAAG